MGRPTPVCVSWRIMPAESTGTFRWSHRQVGENKDYTKVTLLLETMLNNRVQKTHHGLCLFLSSKLQKNNCLFKQGPCPAVCGKIQLGMFSGFGNVRASNRGEEFFCLLTYITYKYFYSISGYCIQDYFSCCNKAREMGLEVKELKTCCKER